MRKAISELGLCVAEGRHTLYFPPQEGLSSLLGELATAYPANTGFKVLKRFAHPAHARYLYALDALGEDAVMGSIGNQAIAAAALSVFGLGPRFYDVAHLRAGSSDLTVLVQEHVDGRVPTMAEYDAFIQALERLRRDRLFSFVHHSGYDCSDFHPPDCNNNLIMSESGPRYVDSQAFQFHVAETTDVLVRRHAEALHFGDVLTVVNRGDTFPYQDIPGRKQLGRREIGARWRLFRSLLERHGGSISGHVIFDVCCNAGMISAQALAENATWAVGWDLPHVAAAARDLLPLRGVGRFTIHGQAIEEEGPLAPPPAFVDGRDGVCFFLAAWHHVGFPHAVGALPWRYLVYEGQENETAERTAQNLGIMEQRWAASVLERTTIEDGLSQPRPVALLTRLERAR